MTTKTVINLPYPPSVNTAFRNLPGGGRARSKGYRAWREEALWKLKDQRPDKMNGTYEMVISACKPDNRKRDIDNLIKPVSDLLVIAGIIKDDSDCNMVCAYWRENGKNGVTVTLVDSGLLDSLREVGGL